MNDLRLPPQNIEIEESILCTILSCPDDDLFELKPTDFYRTAHQKIYLAAEKIYNQFQEVKITELVDTLVKTGELENCGGGSYLSRLMGLDTCIDNKYSVSKIKGLANLRRIIELGNTVTKKSYEAGPDDVESIVDEFQTAALQIGAEKTDNMVTHSDVIMECVEHCEKIQENRGMTGIPTGYSDLDLILCGFQPSDLYILAARPGMGKTAFALNCIINAAGRGFASDFYSLEMARLQIAIRNLSLKSGVNSQKFRSGNFSQEDWVSITNAASELSDYKINIDDTPTSTYQQIQRKARKSKKKNNTDMIWIDYLSFIQGDKGLNRTQEVGTITRGLKQLAKELDIPIILICQLNRSMEQRPNKRPLLSDLRDSGEIEQDADCVMFLYRDDYYNKAEDNPNRGIVELDVRKQRMGPTGTIKLVWSDKTTKFNSMVRDY